MTVQSSDEFKILMELYSLCSFSKICDKCSSNWMMIIDSNSSKFMPKTKEETKQFIEIGLEMVNELQNSIFDVFLDEDEMDDHRI